MTELVIGSAALVIFLGVMCYLGRSWRPRCSPPMAWAKMVPKSSPVISPCPMAGRCTSCSAIS